MTTSDFSDMLKAFAKGATFHDISYDGTQAVSDLKEFYIVLYTDNGTEPFTVKLIKSN